VYSFSRKIVITSGVVVKNNELLYYKTDRNQSYSR
jgi:hypothetical protein